MSSVLCSRPLSQEYKEVAKCVFQSKAGSSTTSSRKSHAEYQDKINGLYANARLFEKGLDLFDGKSVSGFSACLYRASLDRSDVSFHVISNTFSCDQLYLFM